MDEEFREVAVAITAALPDLSRDVRDGSGNGGVGGDGSCRNGSDGGCGTRSADSDGGTTDGTTDSDSTDSESRAGWSIHCRAPKLSLILH